jgi:hypothetical protein
VQIEILIGVHEEDLHPAILLCSDS